MRSVRWGEKPERAGAARARRRPRAARGEERQTQEVRVQARAGRLGGAEGLGRRGPRHCRAPQGREAGDLRASTEVTVAANGATRSSRAVRAGTVRGLGVACPGWGHEGTLPGAEGQWEALSRGGECALVRPRHEHLQVTRGPEAGEGKGETTSHLGLLPGTSGCWTGAGHEFGLGRGTSEMPRAHPSEGGGQPLGSTSSVDGGRVAAPLF